MPNIYAWGIQQGWKMRTVNVLLHFMNKKVYNTLWSKALASYHSHKMQNMHDSAINEWSYIHKISHASFSAVLNIFWISEVSSAISTHFKADNKAMTSVPQFITYAIMKKGARQTFHHETSIVFIPLITFQKAQSFINMCLAQIQPFWRYMSYMT